MQTLQDLSITQKLQYKVQKNTKQTLSAEKTRGGTVKGNRLCPPLMICLCTVHIIWQNKIYVMPLVNI